MSVVLDTSAKSQGTSTVETKCTMTVAAGACLIVGVSCSTNVSVSACAANGTALTQLGRILHTSQGGINVSLFGLTAAPSGVVSISANLVGGGAGTLCLMAGSFVGQKTTNPFGTIILGTASAVATLAVAFSTSTTDMVVWFSAAANNYTATNATTLQVDAAHIPTHYCVTAGTASTISLSVSALTVNQNFAYAGVNIAATITAVASTAVGSLAMLGVGT